MKFSQGTTASIRALFENRQRAANEGAEKRKKELHEKISGVKDIDERLEKTGILILDEIAKGHDGIDGRIARIRAENELLINRRNALLKMNGYPDDYSEPRYHCKICSDSGYSNGYQCVCFKAELARLELERSGLGVLASKQSFDNYDIGLFDEKYRERARRNKEICSSYADSFSKKSDNLLFMGSTGLGKTHMSTSIAVKVIEKGYSVVYVSSQTMISDFASLRYGMGNAEEDEKTEKYFDCDLLIIDDLGTELQTQFSVSVIYNVINSRLCNDMPMIISTNLTPQELKKMYAERITSRLFGNFSPLLFEGRDNRMVIKEKKLMNQ